VSESNTIANTTTCSGNTLLEEESREFLMIEQQSTEEKLIPVSTGASEDQLQNNGKYAGDFCEG
jgi:hypothetical protein